MAQRRFRQLMVAAAAAILIVAGSWMVRTLNTPWQPPQSLQPNPARLVRVGGEAAVVCVTPIGDIFSPNCPPGTGSGGVAVAPPVVVVATPVPCITPAGAIFAPGCAAPPGGGGGGGAVPPPAAVATPVPCITPQGAIFAPGC